MTYPVGAWNPQLMSFCIFVKRESAVYRVERKQGRLEAFFSAELGNVDIFCEDLKKTMNTERLGESIFVTQLLVREALNNAVIHGCKGKSEKRVDCAVEWDGGFLTVHVEDEGKGFDWLERAPKPADTEADSGRGLSIMKEYAEEVVFNGKGNGLSLRISLPTGRKG
jgi:serine/threonine-protein kinase RsbW